MTSLEEQWKKVSTEFILYFCNLKQIRVTYSAVSGVLGIKPKFVGDYLGDFSKRSSWIVGKDTKLPGGKFPKILYHGNLETSKVLESTEELTEALIAAGFVLPPKPEE